MGIPTPKGSGIEAGFPKKASVPRVAVNVSGVAMDDPVEVKLVLGLH